MLTGQCDFSDPLKGLTIQTAQFLCGSELDGFTGVMPGSDSPGIQPDPLCSQGGAVDNIIWFSFIPTSFSINISISYNNCTTSPSGEGIQGGIYGDFDFTDEIACDVFPQSGVPLSLNASGVTPGQIYYLFLDGADGVICDFQINVLSGINDAPFSFEWQDGNDHLGAEVGNNIFFDEHSVCTGADSIYTYIAPTCIARSGSLPIPDIDEFNLYCYEWTISPAAGGVIVGDSNKKKIEIDWQVPGDYTVSVELIPDPDLAACAGDICSDVIPIVVHANPVSEITRDTIFICPGSVESFCGQMIAETTTMECIPDFGTCERVTQPFKLYERDTIKLGTLVNCGSDCFELFGFEYCTNGTYVIQDPLECWKFHEFTIEGFFIDIDVPSIIELDCDSDELNIAPIINTNYDGVYTFQWEENNNLLQSDSILSISRTGTFTFNVNFPDLIGSCQGSATVNVVENTNTPDYQLNIPTIDCQNAIGTLSFIEIDPIDSISWEGADNFQSSLTDLTLNAGGTFTLFIRGENGCTADSTFTISEDDDAPQIVLEYDNLDCINESTTAIFTSDKPVASAQWQSPDNSLVETENLLIGFPGDYTLTVTAENGCRTIVPFEVQENIVYPLIYAGNDQTWQCNTESLNIDGEMEDGPFEAQWGFVEAGLILSDSKEEDIEVGGPGTYILIVSNIDNGCVSRDSVNVLRNENIPEIVEYSITDPSCFQTEDGMLQIMEVFGGTAPYEFFIDGNPTVNNTDFVENLAAGSYELLIKDGFGCELIREIIIEEQPEITLELPNSVEIGFNAQYTFEAIHNIEDGEVADIFWYDENNNIIGTGATLDFLGLEATTITVEVVNINGCSILRTIPIQINTDVPVFTPNVFSPNEDGINDYFTVYTRAYPGQVENLSIFNRWGELMYTVNNLQFNDEKNGWDGTKNGSKSEPAVYTYMARIRLLDDSFKLVSGDVTLIR